MKKQICLDTGIITLLYSKGKPSQITTLFNQIRKDELEAHIVSPIITEAGLLKCQHYDELSYNDCFAVAYALNKKLTFHTTEKNLGKILPNLRIKSYIF